MKVVFRADASPTIGGGHVMRCLALADRLQTLGARCTFATDLQTLSTIPALERSGHQWIELSSVAEVATLSNALDTDSRADWLIVDHYNWDAAQEGACRGWAKKILAIDDLANRRHDCDLLLDQTFGREAVDYEGLVPHRSDIAAGSDYALLKSDFALARTDSLARRGGRKLERVLISVGMTDPGNVTQLILEAILESGCPLKVDVVLGPTAPKLAAVKAVCDRHKDMTTLHVGTAAMADLMCKADFCFGGAGSSSWERCCLGLPTAFVVTAGNQSWIARHLSDCGAAIRLGGSGQPRSSDVANLLWRLMGAPSELERLTLASSRICDGRGAERVAMRIRPEFASDGRPIWLRPVTMKDLKITYALQIEPGTRRFMRQIAVPGEDEHRTWFENRLRDERCLYSIIVCNNESAGVLRLDRMEGEVFEISIIVADAFRAGGIGLAAITLARRLVPEAKLRAEVLSDNVASRSLFARAGFLARKSGDRVIFTSRALSARPMNSGRHDL